MSASKLDELSVDDFDDVVEDRTVDIRSGVIGDTQAEFHAAIAEARKTLADAGVTVSAANFFGYELADEPDYGALDATAPTRLARGTEPGAEVYTSPERVEHGVCSAQLHAALAVVRDLLGVIDCKAHMFQPAQDAIWRAKQLLEEHGKAVKR